MIRLFIVLTIIGFVSTGKVDKEKRGRFEINEVLKSGKKFFVQDSSQYSPKFITELRRLASLEDSISLVGNVLKINKSDTHLIPTELPINEIVNYQAARGDKIYQLSLKRINFTNIDYTFSVNGKQIKSGQARLPATFCFGSEFTEIGNGKAIELSQYFDQNDCWTCIKIEIGTGNRVDFAMICDKDPSMNYQKVPILNKR